MAVSATAKNTGISVQKIKPIIDMIRGKKVDDALGILEFLASPIAALLSKLLKSASANAENELLLRPSDLKIVGIWANEGTSLKRFRARAKGRVGKIVRRNSYITVMVDEEQEDGE
jgi:large subunit ribosomal protein L22